MCPRVDSGSKNEYQVNPGGQGGRCVRLTTYNIHVPMSRNLVALNSWNPVSLFRPVIGQLYLFTTIYNIRSVVRIPIGTRNFSLLQTAQTGSKQPPIFWVHLFFSNGLNVAGA